MRSFSYNEHLVAYHRQISRWALLPVVLLLGAVTVWKVSPLIKEPLMARDKYVFNGQTSDNKNGYVTRVNALLENIIQRHGLSNYQLNNLIEHNNGSGLFTIGDSSLSFYVPPDGDINGLRLVGINKFDNEADSLFYYNSLLPEHLKLQLGYPERKIFNTVFQAGPHNDSLRIRSIRIDESILSAPLVADNLFWPNTIQANTDSLFKDFLFVKLANAWLPVGNYATTDSGERRNPYNLGRAETVDLVSDEDPFVLVRKSVLDGKRIFQVNMGEGKSLQLTKLGNILYILANHTGDLRILHEDGTVDLPMRSGTKYQLRLDGKPFEILFSQAMKNNYGTLYCTPENPFDNLSSIAFHNHTNFRYAVSPKDADLFSAIIARKIPEIENVFCDLTQKGGKDYKLSYNPLLSKYLEGQLHVYMDSTAKLKGYYRSEEVDSSIRMGITLMNTADGSVLAAPWYARDIEQTNRIKDLTNYNFVNHPIGSCFKPLLYFASFRRYPSLTKLKLTDKMVSSFAAFDSAHPKVKKVPVTILGYPTWRFFGDSQGAGEDLVTALSRSSNLYPAMVFLYSLAEKRPDQKQTYVSAIRKGDPFPATLYYGPGTEHSNSCRVAGEELFVDGLERNVIPAIYKSLYAVEDVDLLTNDRDPFEYDYWDRLYSAESGERPGRKLANYGPLSPEKVSLRFDDFNDRDNEKGHAVGGNFRGEIVPWVLGSQNNRWNNVKLCEAFTRVVTGIDNRGSFVNGASRRFRSLYDLTDSLTTLTDTPGIKAFEEAHLELLEALNYDVQSRHPARSTWRDVGMVLKQVKVEGIASPLVILAKTGTADNDKVDSKSDITDWERAQTIRRGAFMFTIMTQAQYDSLKVFIHGGYKEKKYPPRLGITGIISLELKDGGRGEDKNFYSQLARQFLENKEVLRNMILLNRCLFE